MAQEPEIGLEDHARISAEVAEGCETEANVLKRHGITSKQWTDATTRLMTELAEDAQFHGAEARLAVQYSEAFAARQQALKSAPDLAPEQWAELQSDIEREGSTDGPLANRQMSLADYIRLVRVYAKRMVEEPEVALRVQRRQAELQSK